MPDSSDVDNALVAKLGADATLLGIMSNGVYWDEAPPGSSKFVIVSLVSEQDESQFGGRSFEDGMYMVKAVALSKVGVAPADIKAAAARIDQLLDGGTLTVPGYSLMTIRRDSRIRITEVDEVDSSIRWQHRGGNYQVVVSL